MPTYSTFLSNLHDLYKEKVGTSTLLVAPKAFELVRSMELESYIGETEFSFSAIEDVSTTESIEQDDEKFDVVAVLAGVESLARPQQVYQAIWRVLRPGGVCVTYFNGRPHLLSEGPAPVKMWTTMTDEQKIWIAGSYFQYSAPGGWTDILGFDLAGGSGAAQMQFDLTLTSEPSAYAVQASKLLFAPPQVPPEMQGFVGNLSAYLETRLLGVPLLSARDRRFLSLRLAREPYPNSLLT